MVTTKSVWAYRRHSSCVSNLIYTPFSFPLSEHILWEQFAVAEWFKLYLLRSDAIFFSLCQQIGQCIYKYRQAVENNHSLKKKKEKACKSYKNLSVNVWHLKSNFEHNRCHSRSYSSVMLTEARASTAQLGYCSGDGNIRFMNVCMNSGNRPSTMLCLTERIRLNCKEKYSHLYCWSFRKQNRITDLFWIIEVSGTCAYL